MIETLELRTVDNYSKEEVADFFIGRGWPVIFIPVSETNLVHTCEKAPLKCSDGRFDHYLDEEMNSPRVFGQVNAIQAMLTGGGREGLHQANELLAVIGYAPGTHKTCGYYDLWLAGEFEHVLFPPEIVIHDILVGPLLKTVMKSMGGEHFKIDGPHREEATRLNPFIHTTEYALDGKRFRVDDWLFNLIGISGRRRWLQIAETVEKLRPEATKLEILTR